MGTNAHQEVGVGAATGGYRNDEDADIPVSENRGGYRDPDDRSASAFGSTAGRSTTRAVALVVERYYAAAAAADGRRACSMLLPSLARAVPVDYGGSSPAAPAYLRGQKTCPAVMTLIFKRSHSLLEAPVAVTGVLVNGANAFALLGSKAMHASYISLQLERGTWTVDEPLGGTLP